MFRTVLVFLTLIALCLAGATYAGRSAEESRFRGGEAASLRGLHAWESQATDLDVVNLSSSGNRCAFTRADGNGVRLGPVMTLTLRPREERSFLDTFERLAGPEGVS